MPPLIIVLIALSVEFLLLCNILTYLYPEKAVIIMNNLTASTQSRFLKRVIDLQIKIVLFPATILLRLAVFLRGHRDI